jgi:hypothetical protein
MRNLNEELIKLLQEYPTIDIVSNVRATMVDGYGTLINVVHNAQFNCVELTFG